MPKRKINKSAKIPKSQSLAVKHPLIAVEWHPDKNNPLTPKDVYPHSQEIVWWKCAERGHVWQKEIWYRYYSLNCPLCRKEEVERKRKLRDAATGNES
jgi:hypothetical protein